MEEIKILSDDGLKFFNDLMDSFENKATSKLPKWSGRGFMHLSTIRSAKASLEDIENLYQGIGLYTVKIELSAQDSPDKVEVLGLAFAKNAEELDTILLIFQESLENIDVKPQTLN